MKRKDILRILAEAGYTFKEGGNHTKGYDKDGNFKTTIGRHAEIPEKVVAQISRQTGIQFR